MKKFYWLVIVIVILASCSGNGNLKKLSVESRMLKAEELFKKGKWRRAAEIFETVVYERTSGITDIAMYHLAECYFNKKDYFEARVEYEDFVNSFPDSPNAEDAYFKIGICYMKDSLSPHYTQDETIKAAEAFETFIDKYPDSDKVNEAIANIQKCKNKITEKAYWNGYIYYKMSDYSSAWLYFEEVINQNLKNKFGMKAIIYSIKIHEHWNDTKKVDELKALLKKRFPEVKENR